VIANAIKRRCASYIRCVSARAGGLSLRWWIGGVFVAIAGTCFSWLAYHDATRSDMAQQEFQARSSRLEKENAGLKSELAVLERQLQIERATYGDLVKQVKVLSIENARLKEDVALVQAIAGADAKVDGVKLSSVRVQPNGVEGEYSYRIVLLQTGARRKPFQGSYQLVVNLVQDGTRHGLTVPGVTEKGEQPYRLDFRVHQRIEGTFQVEPNAVVRSVQVRVYEQGQSQPKIMETVTLS